MNLSPNHPNPGVPHDDPESIPHNRGENHNIHNFNRTEDDGQTRAMHLISGSVVFHDDFGITLND
jgi:hypothetical protein